MALRLEALEVPVVDVAADGRRKRQLAVFPYSRFDDLVDATAQFLGEGKGRANSTI